MRILFSSYVFSPGIGGIETVSALLAPEFVRAGHDVILITKTSKDDGLKWPFPVIRNPSLLQLLKLVRWGDVYFQNNISLELAWPLLLISRPWIIAHHTWLDQPSENLAWKGLLKRYLLRFANHATISKAMATSLPGESLVLGNPYDSQVFRPWPGIARDKELVYLGRLVSDKGIDLLLDALAELKRREITPRLTIIGSGPEMKTLQDRAERSGILSQIEFAGPRKGEELARMLHAYRIMVIPSRWPEPFGVVALEGIACGCGIIASSVGGLPDAIGPCGLLCEPDSPVALANALEEVLSRPSLITAMQNNAVEHLSQFTPPLVAARYLGLFEKAFQQKNNPPINGESPSPKDQ